MQLTVLFEFGSDYSYNYHFSDLLYIVVFSKGHLCNIYATVGNNHSTSLLWELIRKMEYGRKKENIETKYYNLGISIEM
jgi:hypothetical protein